MPAAKAAVAQSCRRSCLLALASLALAGLSADAGAQTVTFFNETFEGGVSSPAWRGGVAISTDPAFSNFAGRFSLDQAATLDLIIPPTGILGTGQPETYFLMFDLYTIDSWDGYAVYGPDSFEVKIGGRSAFFETFATVHEYQSFRRPDVGPTPMGYRPAPDAIYRNIEIPYDAPAGQMISIVFQGSVMQGLQDESWGIDNIRLSATSIPAPSAAGALGLAGLLAGRRRRPATAHTPAATAW